MGLRHEPTFPAHSSQGHANQGAIGKILDANLAMGTEERVCTFNGDIPLAQGDFTESANFAVLFARLNAATFNFASRRVDPVSLLVGLSLERSGEAGKILRSRGVTVRSIRMETGDSVATKSALKDLESLIFDAEVRRIFGNARKMCRNDRQRFVTSMHLLEAILRTRSTPAKTVLASLIDDVAALRAFLPAKRMELYEGRPEELELNEQLLKVMQSGEPVPLHFLPELSSGPAQTLTPVTFDLVHLSPQCQVVMEEAMKEFTAMRRGKFTTVHLLLGLIKEGRSPAARYLTEWGLTTRLIKSKMADYETEPQPPGDRPHLDDNVSVFLSNALAMAKSCDMHQATPEHLLWSITNSGDLALQALLEKLGVNWIELSSASAKLCLPGPPPEAPFSRRFPATATAGLLVYSMVCEPAVAMVMQIALAQAGNAGVNTVCGGFLLLALLLSPADAGNVLSALGLTTEALLAAMSDYFQLAGKDATSDVDYSPILESVFYKGLSMSLAKRKVAVDTADLLGALIESHNVEAISLLKMCKIEPDLITEKLELLRRSGRKNILTALTIDRLSNAVSMPLSAELEVVFEIAAEMHNHNLSPALELHILLYALGHEQAGSISSKLRACGLDYISVKQIVDDAILWHSGPLSSADHDQDGFTPVLTEAESLAAQLGSTRLRCEHLMLAILETCQKCPYKGLLEGLGIDVKSLYMQLFVKELLNKRALNLAFGDQLTNRLDSFDLAGMAVLVNAAVMAATAGRNYIDVDHLIAAISNCSNDALVAQMEKYGLVGERVEAIVAKFASPSIEYTPAAMSCSGRVSQVFDSAQALTKHSGLGATSVAQLFLALLQDPDVLTTAILSDLNVDKAGLIKYLQTLSVPSEPVINSIDESKISGAQAAPQPQLLNDEFELPNFAAETVAIFHAAKKLAAVGLSVAGGPSSFLEPCHVLLALLESPLYARLVGVDQFAPDPDKVSGEATGGDGERTEASSWPFSPRTRSLIAEALEQCKLFGRQKERIFPEHLLLAIFAEPDQQCSAILLNMAAVPHAAKLRIVGYINERDRRA